MRALRLAVFALVPTSLLLVLFNQATTEAAPGAIAPETPLFDAPTAAASAAAVGDDERLRVPATAAAGVYAAAPGTRMLFDFRAETTTTLQQGGDHPARTDQAMTFTGVLRIEVLGRDGEAVVYAASYPTLTATATAGGQVADAAPLAAVTTALGDEVLVRMQPDGTLLGLQFPRPMPAETRLQARALLALPRFVVPTPITANWTTRECDVNGERAVEYQLLAQGESRLRVRRQRQSCTMSGAGDAPVAAAVIDQSTAEFDRALGWVVDTTCDESTEGSLGFGEIVVRARSRCALRLREHELVAARAAAIGADWASADGLAEVAANAAEREAASDDELLGKATFGDLLRDLDHVLQDQGQRSSAAEDAVQRLGVFFRRRQWQTETVRDELRRRDLPMTTRSDLLSALGRSNSPTAQVLLTDLVSEPGAEEELRAAAVFACHQLREPQPALAAAVLAIVQGDAKTSPLPGMAVLLLGTCAGRQPALMPQLLEQEASLLQRGLGATYVEALRNAQAWDQIERLRTSDDPQARDRAERVLADR